MTSLIALLFSHKRAEVQAQQTELPVNFSDLPGDPVSELQEIRISTHMTSLFDQIENDLLILFHVIPQYL
ncbi:MAG: hypothetical protein NZM00_15020 [Anaerolinea sp.]|nr:hypothetical protein [Anaerolinea sp.]